MAGLGFWWTDESAPPLEDWRRYREVLAGSMYGPDFQTVDGAFHRVAPISNAGGEPDSRRLTSRMRRGKPAISSEMLVASSCSGALVAGSMRPWRAS
jgi:hypothetical protein